MVGVLKFKSLQIQLRRVKKTRELGPVARLFLDPSTPWEHERAARGMKGQIGVLFFLVGEKIGERSWPVFNCVEVFPRDPHRTVPMVSRPKELNNKLRPGFGERCFSFESGLRLLRGQRMQFYWPWRDRTGALW